MAGARFRTDYAMKLSSELEAQGLKAYEQKRAFEALRRRGLPWIYVGFATLLWMSFILAARTEHVRWLDFMLLGIATVFTLIARSSWTIQRDHYEENCKLLDEMRLRYGDELPWLQVERQSALLDEIKRELAKKQGPSR